MMRSDQIISTVGMIQKDNLDVRTITMGINLLDCRHQDVDVMCRRVVNKIEKYAGDLVDVCDQIVTKYGVFLTIGVYAVECHDDAQGKMQNDIRDRIMQFDGILQVHGILIDTETKLISFDAVVDFKVADKAALRQQLVDALLQTFGYTVEINFDIDYSD